MDAIKRSYRNLVKLWHPDRYAPGSSMQAIAQEKLKLINQAYADICKRRGKQAPPSASGPVKTAYSSGVTPETEPPRTRASGAPETEDHARKTQRKPRAAHPEPDWDDTGWRSAAARDAGARGGRPGRASAERPQDRDPPPRAGRPRATASPKTPQRSILPIVAGMVGFGGIAALLIVCGRIAYRQITAPSPDAPEAEVAPARAEEVRGESDPAGTPGEGSSIDQLEAIRRQIDVASSETSAILSQVDEADGGTRKPVPLVAAGRPAAVLRAPAPSRQPTIVAARQPEAQIAPIDRTRAFSVGATRDEVLAVEGRPDHETANVMQYGTASIALRNGRVSSWEDKSGVLLRGRREPVPDEPVLDSFTVGSTRDQVIMLQGRPDQATDVLLRYGSSSVTLAAGRVSGWHEGDTLLKARVLPTLLFDRAQHFGLGSSKAEVIAVQGKPDQFSESLFKYGSSTVQFRNDHVVGWREGIPALKLRTGPDAAFGKSDVFSVGSTRAQVIAIQGPPDMSTPSLLRYGTAVIRLENDRVVSWVDSLRVLKARPAPAGP